MVCGCVWPWRTRGGLKSRRPHTAAVCSSSCRGPSSSPRLTHCPHSQHVGGIDLEADGLLADALVAAHHTLRLAQDLLQVIPGSQSVSRCS